MKAWNKITTISIGILILIAIIVNTTLTTMQDEAIPNATLVEINRMYNQLQSGVDVSQISAPTINLRVVEYDQINLDAYINQTKNSVVVLPSSNGKFYQFMYEIDRIPSSLIWIINSFFCMAIAVLIGLKVFVYKQIIQPFHQLEYMAEALKNRDFSYELPQQKYKFLGKFIWAIDVMKEELRYHEDKELQLMKDKKVMISSMSHDVKTPLSNIRLYTDALDLGLYPNSLIQQRVYENCDKIDQYVKDILTTNSENLFDFEVHMQEVYLHDVWHILQQEQERIQLALIDYQQVTCEDTLIYTDLYRLKEVLNNVIDNAIKYGDGKWIHVSFYDEDHRKIMKIENSGKTMDSKDTNAIFQSFYRGNNIKKQKGNGLGLYICKQLMKKMDGDIFMSQEKDCVSFHIVLGMMS